MQNIAANRTYVTSNIAIFGSQISGFCVLSIKAKTVCDVDTMLCSGVEAVSWRNEEYFPRKSVESLQNTAFRFFGGTYSSRCGENEISRFRFRLECTSD